MTSTSENRHDTAATILDSNALALDLVQQAYTGVMDCDVRRTGVLVLEATQDMTPDELRRLIHQVAWIGGALAALLPDNERLTALARLSNTNGDKS